MIWGLIIGIAAGVIYSAARTEITFREGYRKGRDVGYEDGYFDGLIAHVVDLDEDDLK